MERIRELLGIPSAGDMGPMLVLCLILVAGMAGGWLAKRLHVPSVTGNILAGVLIGPAVLNLFDGINVKENLAPLSTFAMALISVAVGSQLSFQRLHNAWRRVISIASGEVVGVLLLVTAAMLLAARLPGMPDMDWTTALMLAVIASNSSPATIVSVIRESRAKGTYVKTLLAVVGIDNMLCILLFSFARMVMVEVHSGAQLGPIVPVLHTLYQMAGAVLLGLTLGYATERMVHKPHIHDFSTVFVAILLAVGISSFLAVSPLLTSLVFGIYLGNASEEAQRQTRALEPIEMLLFVVFFTVAGISLHLDKVIEAGWLCVIFVSARFAGKAAGAFVGGVLSGTTPRIWSNTGLGLMPQAGVATGLVVLLSSDTRLPAEIGELITTVVLAGVCVAEILGPFLTRMALRRAKEANKDRRRLIEFLQEEYITTRIQAQDKWEALRKITDFYIRTHRVPVDQREKLHASVLERERDVTTAVGRGAAIPHGRVERGGHIRGVLGILPEGVDWESLDGEPVRLIMLVVTPVGHDREHLEVMASLASMISNNAILTRLLAAIDANDAWEVIESEENSPYNYYLDEEDLDSRSHPAKG